jgi:predicted permease
MTQQSEVDGLVANTDDLANRRAEQAAQRAFRTMRGAFGLGFLVLALLAGIVYGEVGFVVLLVFMYGGIVVFASWGRRLLMQRTNRH